MSQFCIVLLNNDEQDGNEIPNANVNMEYGLMLGFNKYVIPFQRRTQRLPFNVAGLDTIKYTDQDLEQQAITAIEQAIDTTKQEETPSGTTDQPLQMYLLARNMVFAYVDSEGEKNIFKLGEPLGFNLINDFTGTRYEFLGRFSNLRPEVILWRLRKMNEMLNGRLSSIDDRIKIGAATPEQAVAARELFENLQLLVIVTSDQDKTTLVKELDQHAIDYPVEVILVEEILSQVKTIQEGRL